MYVCAQRGLLGVFFGTKLGAVELLTHQFSKHELRGTLTAKPNRLKSSSYPARGAQQSISPLAKM